MLIPYITGMLTVFGLFIIKELYDYPKLSQNINHNINNIFITNQTIIMLNDDMYFPYETIYLRGTAVKYKEFDTMLSNYKKIPKDICLPDEYEKYNNASLFMCWD